MNIIRYSIALIFSFSLVIASTPSAKALPLITSVTEFGTMNAAGPKALDVSTPVVSSATSPGPANTSGALVNEAFWATDRTHELTNARINASGVLSTNNADTLLPFPYYLQGLEYVQLSNDNKDMTDYKLDVTLSAPATAFLFIDNRTNGPAVMNNNPNTAEPILGGSLQWVIDDGWTRVNSGFMPNGRPDYIGVDEAATVASADLRAHTGGGNEAGPGNGLQNFYAIFRKNFTAGTHAGFTKQYVPGGNQYIFAVAPTVGPIVPGDVNRNGTTDINDYTVIRNNFNKAGTHTQGDLNGDGSVGLADFRFWKNYRSDAGIGASDGELLAGLGAVPEPGSVALALLASIMVAGALARRGNR